MKRDDLGLWLLASPVLAAKAAFLGVRRINFWRVSYMTSITCQSCQAEISLVGIWKCPCGFTYRGHLLIVCPVCQSVPRMARCFGCGSTEKLPRR